MEELAFVAERFADSGCHCGGTTHGMVAVNHERFDTGQAVEDEPTDPLGLVRRDRADVLTQPFVSGRMLRVMEVEGQERDAV